jgi:hypothetical protein
MIYILKFDSTLSKMTLLMNRREYKLMQLKFGEFLCNLYCTCEILNLLNFLYIHFVMIFEK